MKRRLFTLIELLVVIAIMAILMTLLLPALGKARSTAKQAGCASRLKQMAIGFVCYGNDNNGRITASGCEWAFAVAPYLENGKDWDCYKMSPMARPGGVWSCPEDPDGKLAKAVSTMNYQVAWAIPWAVYQTPTTDYLSRKVSEYLVPSAKLLLIDGTYRFFWYNADFVLGARLAGRHNCGSNILFVDGHVKRYGYPPLPVSYISYTVAQQWCSPDVAPSPNL